MANAINFAGDPGRPIHLRGGKAAEFIRGIGRWRAGRNGRVVPFGIDDREEQRLAGGNLAAASLVYSPMKRGNHTAEDLCFSQSSFRDFLH